MTDLAATDASPNSSLPLPHTLLQTPARQVSYIEPTAYREPPTLLPPDLMGGSDTGPTLSDLSGLPLGAYAPVEYTPLPWAEVWSQLMAAKLRFRSTLWANDRCVVVFHQSRSNVRQFALSPRELLVLSRTLQGESQKAIALEQGLSAS